MIRNTGRKTRDSSSTQEAEGTAGQHTRPSLMISHSSSSPRQWHGHDT